MFHNKYKSQDWQKIMSLIKIHVLTQEIDKKIEIFTHELLKTYNISDYPDNYISILLPCPLDRIQIIIDSNCFCLELRDNMDIEIQQCVKCKNINLKKNCLCKANVKYLKMHVIYVSNRNISYCSKEILDILLGTIQYTYISTLKEKSDGRSPNRILKFIDSAVLNETLSKTGKYFNLRDINQNWVIEKQFRTNRTCSKAWKHIVNISKLIKNTFFNFRWDILNVFSLSWKIFKMFRKQNNKKKVQPIKDTNNGFISEYLSFINRHLSIILNYSNDEVLDMIREILGLSYETVNQKNILKVDKSSFEFYIFKRSHKIINRNLDESYRNLININEDSDEDFSEENENNLNCDINPGNIILDDEKFEELYSAKLNVINFICSLHKKIKSVHSNQICIQLQNIKLDLTKNKNNGYISRKLKVKINGESLFSNDKLISFYLDTAKIHQSQNRPLQLTFQDEKCKLKNYLYKENSELSIDIFFNSLTEYIYELVGCPYNLYNLLMISQQSGIIEMKQGRLISSFESVQQLKRFLIFSEDDYTSLTDFKQYKGFSKSKIDNFLKSLAISILICYLFEIRDRTSDNILMDKEGIVFNIDYEYTLGSSPSYLNPKIEIPSLISLFLKSDSLILNKFYHLLSNYFKIIRNNHLKILMVSKILTTNRPTYFNQTNFEKMFLSKLHLGIESSVAEGIMMESFKKSLGSYKTKIKEFLACVKREIING